MSVVPYQHLETGKKEQVRSMFNNIAQRYDFLNNVLSFGIDKYWRKRAIRELRKENPKQLLDMATGTGDFAIACLKVNPDKITGIDLSPGMLEYGRIKLAEKQLANKIELLEGDSEQIQFSDAYFDAATVAFGVRNFENLEKGIKELYRVIKPNGILVVLEFSQPTNPVFASIYSFYFKNILPKIGKLFSKDFAAYNYLYESVQVFPYGNAFLEVMRNAGFKETKCIPLTLGICSVYVGRKK
jgi:demethylmenaquinone methyltransferase/2-methoxy-6-polyprenyl-1,4-benzoquinol methylase